MYIHIYLNLDYTEFSLKGIIGVQGLAFSYIRIISGLGSERASG